MAQRRALKDIVRDPMVKKWKKDAHPIQKSAFPEQREIAKAGMVSSLGALLVTGFVKFKGAGLLHIWAGWALLGFSLWHHVLNTPKSKVISEDR